MNLPVFMRHFISRHLASTQNDQLERSWYFEEKEQEESQSRGYVHYGTFGFESNLVNSRTNRTQYRRQIDDVEEIPLFYEAWFPEENFGLLSFQSFQGRSCISIVMYNMQEEFERVNPSYAIRFKKLLPNGRSGSLYYDAPVKRLRLIKRNASVDETDRYFPGTNPRDVSFEVAAIAKKNRTLGTFGAISRELREGAAGVVLHDGIAFDEAVAEISVGGKLRRVGVFGSDSEAGVIDLTEDVERGLDGHPTFESLAGHSDQILQDFYRVLVG